MTFDEVKNLRLEELENRLNEITDCKAKYHQTVVDSMRYSLLKGGKRVRAMLVMGFYESMGGDYHDVIDTAAAIEMVHAYSLIHDDLPCMDNDDYRRGKLTNHKVYGEAVAVLAGDGLLTYAFETLAENAEKFPAESVVKAIKCLSEGAGFNGMIGGQVIDIENEGKKISEDMLHDLHSRKTGALIKAACKLGVIMAGGDEEALNNAEEYGKNIGIAFQIQDDILDVEGNPEILGKSIGNDAENNKTTFVTIYGIDKSKELAEEYFKNAYTALEKIKGPKDFLIELTNFLTKRKW